MIHRGEVSATAYGCANVIRHHLSPGTDVVQTVALNRAADLAYLRGSCRVYRPI
jgi:hypothetical protein